MSQQNFSEFMQLQGVTKRILYLVLGKLKFLNIPQWRIKAKAPKHNFGVSCKVSYTAVEGVEKFIQTGKEEESLTETRMRLYRQMKTKTY